MKKTLLVFSVIATASLQVANGTVAGFGAVPTARTVVDSTLATVSTSGLVWVGTFANESFVFNPALSITANVAAITTAGVWHQFGLDTVTNLPNAGVTSNLSISAGGKVGGSVTDNNFGATKADFFNSKPLYLWIFNASTPGASTEMGIFHATSATIPWTFATNAGGVGDGVTYSSTDAAAPTIAAIGGAGSTTTGSPGTLRLAAAVPEPSVLTLAGLAGLGLLCSRRRRRNASRA